MYMGRSRPSRRLSPANPARGLRVRTRRCITHEPPRRVPNRLGGSFDSRLPRPNASQASRPRRIQTHCLWGGGFYVRYSNQPLAQCKGRSDPFTEISPDAPTTRRFGPLSPEDRARRVAELRTVLAAPAFQARLAPGNRGSSRELPYNPVLHAGRGPADRTGGECAPGDPVPRRASPSPPSPTTSPPTPGSRPPTCGCWRPSSTSPEPTPAAGPATTRSLTGSICHPGTVRRSLRHLEDLGYIRRQPSRGESHRSPDPPDLP